MRVKLIIYNEETCRRCLARFQRAYIIDYFTDLISRDGVIRRAIERNEEDVLEAMAEHHCKEPFP